MGVQILNRCECEGLAFSLGFGRVFAIKLVTLEKADKAKPVVRRGRKATGPKRLG